MKNGDVRRAIPWTIDKFDDNSKTPKKRTELALKNKTTKVQKDLKMALKSNKFYSKKPR